MRCAATHRRARGDESETEICYTRSTMPLNEHDPVSRLLERMAEGDAAAGHELYPQLFRELHGMAHRLMRGERHGHTLQTTALVNEAWLRFKPEASTPETRAHFMFLAARAMRQVLVDHARKRNAKKRDGGERHALFDDVLARWEGDPTELLTLDAALDRLGERDEALRRLVELRYYAGCTLEEAGNLMGMTVRQVHRRWTFARGWLRRELDKGLPDEQ